MSGIFISYRRKDTAAYAGWLFQTLKAHFGEDQLFRDLDNIDLGDRFPEVIEEAIASCDVVIALIGEKWLAITDENGRPRLQDPADHVRRELVAALRRDDVLLIPVLLDGTVIPPAKALPPPLRGLTERNALSLDSADWDDDVGRLIEAVERKVPRLAHPVPPEAPGPGDTPTTSLPSGLGTESGPAEREPRAAQTGKVAVLATPASRLSGRRQAWLTRAALGAVAVAVLTGIVLAGGISTAKTTAPTSVPPTTATSLPDPTTTTPTTTAPSTVAPRPTTPAPTTTARPSTTVTTIRPSTTTTSTTLANGPDTCKSGFVWRETRPTDHVCVTPDTRQAVRDDNGQARARWVDGPYGPHTCLDGFVWRDAFSGDDVCVTPRTRDQAAYDNSQASSRLQSFR